MPVLHLNWQITRTGLEASEEYLRFATESKNKLANLIGGIALRGGLEELEGLEKDIKRVVKDPAQLSWSHPGARVLQ